MVGIPAVVRLRARALLPLGILLPAFLLAAACPVLSGPAAHAQEVAPARALRLSLYAARIGWTPGRPGTFGATLHRQGRLIASARTKASTTDPSPQLTLRPEEAASDAMLRPGDRLDLRSGPLHQRFVIPTLAAVVDRQSKRVWGRGPLTGTLTLSDLSQTAAARVALVTDADGGFNWEPDAGRSIPHGAEGSLRWESPDGTVRVEQLVSAPVLHASAAGNDLAVRSSTGDRITVANSWPRWPQQGGTQR